MSRPRVLIAWNQVEEDIYERWRAHGPEWLPWDPARRAAEVRTVREEMDDLIRAVGTGNYDVICINVRDDIDRLLSALRLYRPDVVFNLVEYLYDDEGLEASLVGLYDVLGMPYTGSASYALSMCRRKHHTKVLLEGAGLPTAPHFVVEHLDAPMPDPDALGQAFPFIVKPALEDASGGIDAGSVVASYPALVERVRYVVREFAQPALIEQYIDGREIHAAILGNLDAEVLPLFEMRFDDSDVNPTGEWRPRIISYDGKWDPLSRDFYTLEPVCPATDIEPQLEHVIAAVALRAYRVTGCRDYARIDMRLAHDGTPYILEVNPNPDLTDGSAFIMCATASGRSYANTLHEIIEMARHRDADTGDDPQDDAIASDLPTDRLNRKYHRRPLDA